MFEHIGKKVKFFSQALFWLGAAAKIMLISPLAAIAARIAAAASSAAALPISSRV